MSIRLQELVRDNKLEEIEQFLKNNKDIDIITNNFEQTSLMIAIESEKLNIIDVLLKYNPNFNKQDFLGVNVLMLALMTNFNEKIIYRLIEHMNNSNSLLYNLNLEDQKGKNIFYYNSNNPFYNKATIISIEKKLWNFHKKQIREIFIYISSYSYFPTDLRELIIEYI